jgi:hypothetical protein
VRFRAGDLFYVWNKEESQTSVPLLSFYISGGGFPESGIGKSRVEGVHRVCLHSVVDHEEWPDVFSWGRRLWIALEYRQKERGGLSTRWLSGLIKNDRDKAPGEFRHTFVEYIPISS